MFTHISSLVIPTRVSLSLFLSDHPEIEETASPLLILYIFTKIQQSDKETDTPIEAYQLQV